MYPEIISEYEFKKRFCQWLLENKRSFRIDSDDTVEGFAQTFRLPDFDYVHTQSLPDENGDLTTLLRCDYELRDWQTRNGKEHVTFSFYCVLKTYLDRVEEGPEVYGYCIIK